METVIPVFDQQIDRAADELEALKADYRKSKLSPDAIELLDVIAVKISSDLFDTRLQLAEAHAELNSDKLDQASDAILQLYNDISELRDHYLIVAG